MNHYQNRVTSGRTNPAAGTNTAIDDQIDEALVRIRHQLEHKFGSGTAKTMLTGLETFEETLQKMTDNQSLLALNSQGQPATPIGTGSVTPPSQDDVTSALDVIGKALTARGTGYEHQVKLVRRALSLNTDPDFIEASDDGTPKAIRSLTVQVNGYRNDRDLLDWLLGQLGAGVASSNDHYDANGSKARLQPLVNNVGGVKRADLAAKVATARAKVESITGGVRPGIVIGKQDAITAIKAIEELTTP